MELKKSIMLYILPLNDEEQIHFTGGKFVTPEENRNEFCPI